MSDKIVNFYDKLGIKGAVLPKTWKKHHMFNKCHTLCIGGNIYYIDILIRFAYFQN